MLFYRVVRRGFRLVGRVVFDFRVEGVEHVPASGAAVLVAPHRSWLDPACVGAASPRPVRFLILASVYHKPWARWFYRGMRGIPVAASGRQVHGALRGALGALAAGELVGVFPEGRVLARAEPGRMRPGAALLATRAGAPVIPVGIDGSARAWPHGRRWPRPAPVRVRIGAPIPPPGGSDRGAVLALTETIERVLGELESAG